MKNVIYIIGIVLVIGMCFNNGYYVESDKDWNIESDYKLTWYTPQQFNNLYSTTSSSQNINIYK